MNCKQGDLAVIVRSYAGNEGKIVRCVRLSYAPCLLPGGALIERCPLWETDAVLLGCSGRSDEFVPDFQLRPIRDNDGEDEMLRIAGLPNKQEVAA